MAVGGYAMRKLGTKPKDTWKRRGTGESCGIPADLVRDEATETRKIRAEEVETWLYPGPILKTELRVLAD